MKDSLPVKRQSYTDKTRFMVYVLWLHGSTQTAIAGVVGLRRKQVAGIIVRSDYPNRAALSLQERANFLKELRLVREEDGVQIDGGVLPDAVFTPRAL